MGISLRESIGRHQKLLDEMRAMFDEVDRRGDRFQCPTSPIDYAGTRCLFRLFSNDERGKPELVSNEEYSGDGRDLENYTMAGVPREIDRQWIRPNGAYDPEEVMEKDPPRRTDFKLRGYK